jgi:hypothetical protein
VVKQCNNINALIEECDYWLIDLYSSQAMTAFQTGWEQTRFVAYVTAQSQSTKKLKIEDVMRFPWEHKKKTKTQALDAGEVERIKKQMKALESKGLKS